MRKGFTVIELLVVIVIIVVLASLVLPILMGKNKIPTVTLIELKKDWAEWEVEEMRDSGEDSRYVWLVRKVSSNVERKKVRVDAKTFELLLARWEESRRVRSLTHDLPVEAEKAQ